MRSQCRLIWLGGVCSRSYFLLCSNIGSLILDLELANFNYQRKMLSRTTSKCENVFVYSKTFVVVLGRFCVHSHFSMCLQKHFFGAKISQTVFFSNTHRLKLIGSSIFSSWPSPIPTQQDQNWNLINSMNMDRFVSGAQVQIISCSLWGLLEVVIWSDNERGEFRSRWTSPPPYLISFGLLAFGLAHFPTVEPWEWDQYKM